MSGCISDDVRTECYSGLLGFYIFKEYSVIYYNRMFFVYSTCGFTAVIPIHHFNRSSAISFESWISRVFPRLSYERDAGPYFCSLFSNTFSRTILCNILSVCHQHHISIKTPDLFSSLLSVTRVSVTMVKIRKLLSAHFSQIYFFFNANSSIYLLKAPFAWPISVVQFLWRCKLHSKSKCTNSFSFTKSITHW